MATVLVIDDDPLVAQMVNNVLRTRRYEVLLASNGMEGLRIFQTRHPDLVITDIVMPVKEGLDTIRLLRTWAPELKIIAMSGGGLGGNRDPLRAATELGATAIIAKPFRAEQLLVLVADTLSG
ncbi:MAG TPA: response regulator [Stellaceae bacterium]|nr:response regulator [Stellaceae bacterium]